ncbi:MAG TPA: hypothetical protein EYO31_03295 [Phycisphaerales bacterium]|nr:hypothetical protein [Phycisphaerales bacterium]
MLANPVISDWTSLVASPSGVLFGKPLTAWRESARKQLGLSEKPHIVVGHQPEFFHPGILAKFIAGSHIAKEVNGTLVHLVVDHHFGVSGKIEIPNQEGRYVTSSTVEIAPLITGVAMKDQPRVFAGRNDAFSTALNQAEGSNAAMQFANATNSMMSQWAKVGATISGTSLLESDLGKAIVEEMQSNPAACIDAYNNAIDLHPSSTVAKLDTNELPLWQGKTNAVCSGIYTDLRPRALLLTLLTRLLVGDLFVHGTGGASYDVVMEQWASDWLSIVPCAMTTVTATVRLPLHAQSIEDARRMFFSPPKSLVEAIENAPYGSAEKKLQFLVLQKWLAKNSQKPDIASLKKAHQIARKRDWAFPLYSDEQLTQLKHELIN